MATGHDPTPPSNPDDDHKGHEGPEGPEGHEGPDPAEPSLTWTPQPGDTRVRTLLAAPWIWLSLVGTGVAAGLILLMLSNGSVLWCGFGLIVTPLIALVLFRFVIRRSEKVMLAQGAIRLTTDPEAITVTFASGVVNQVPWPAVASVTHNARMLTLRVRASRRTIVLSIPADRVDKRALDRFRTELRERTGL